MKVEPKPRAYVETKSKGRLESKPKAKLVTKTKKFSVKLGPLDVTAPLARYKAMATGVFLGVLSFDWSRSRLLYCQIEVLKKSKTVFFCMSSLILSSTQAKTE